MVLSLYHFRYLNLSELVPPGDVRHLYDTDNQNSATVVSKGRSSVSPPHQEKPKPGEYLNA